MDNRAVITSEVRALLRTLIIAAAGCVVIVVVAPFVKLLVVQGALERAMTLSGQGRNVDARHILSRHEPWAVTFPSVSQTYRCVMIQACVRAGDLRSADAIADELYSCRSSGMDTSGLQASSGMLAPLVTAPTLLVNRLVALAHGNAYTVDPDCGHNTVICEIQKLGSQSNLAVYAQHVLDVNPANPRAAATLEFLRMSAQEKKRTTTVRDTTGQTPTQSPAVTEPLPVSLVPPEVIPPGQDLEPDPAALTASLREKEAGLVSQIARRKAELAARPPTPAESRYARAKGTLGDCQRRDEQLRTEFDRAVGPRRSQVLDQLRILKGDVARAEKELLAAETELKRNPPPRGNDPTLSQLEQDLARIRQELADL